MTGKITYTKMNGGRYGILIDGQQEAVCWKDDGLWTVDVSGKRFDCGTRRHDAGTFVQRQLHANQPRNLAPMLPQAQRDEMAERARRDIRRQPFAKRIVMASGFIPRNPVALAGLDAAADALATFSDAHLAYLEGAAVTRQRRSLIEASDAAWDEARDLMRRIGVACFVAEEILDAVARDNAQHVR